MLKGEGGRGSLEKRSVILRGAQKTLTPMTRFGTIGAGSGNVGTLHVYALLV